MVSQKTGALSGWVHTSNLNTPDGEFRGWIFTPMPRTLRALPHLQGVEVHIYND